MGAIRSDLQAVGGLPPATHNDKKRAIGTKLSPARCFTTWDGNGHIPLETDPLYRGRASASSSAVNSSKSERGVVGAASGGASLSKNMLPSAVTNYAGGTADCACACACAYA